MKKKLHFPLDRNLLRGAFGSRSHLGRPGTEVDASKIRISGCYNPNISHLEGETTHLVGGWGIHLKNMRTSNRIMKPQESR